MRGRKLTIFLALILVTMFVCKTSLPSDSLSKTAAINDKAVTN
jgi:hypothetical protein